MKNSDESAREFRRQALLLKQRSSSPSAQHPTSARHGNPQGDFPMEIEKFVVGRVKLGTASRDEQLRRHAAIVQRLMGK